jgi:3'-phosphoadenosine 5'-phosphosulfate sulfotransferase (PAPS reductase)/FAD synthetase
VVLNLKGSYRRSSPNETSRRLNNLKHLQSLSLDEKIKLSIKIIEQSFEIGNGMLLYSGGKDSTVLLDLITKINRNIPIMYNNTGLVRQNFLDSLRKKTEKYNYIETMADDPFKMWDEKKYYPILTKRGFTKYKKKFPALECSPVQCCYQLKEKYSNPVFKEKNTKIVFWGNRAGESNRRKFGFCDNGFIFKPKKYNWHQSYPLQHWLDADILYYLTKNSPDYKYKSISEGGCWACAVDIQYNPNNMIFLYNNNYSDWVKLMRSGFAKNILIANGVNVDSVNIDKLIADNPKALLRVFNGKKKKR